MVSLASQHSQITINVKISQGQDDEFIATMLQWEQMVPTIYFLDICAIAHIKTYRESKSFKDEKHKESIHALRDIDLRHNSVSYLPALMEKASDLRSKFSAEDFVLEAQRDWDAMGAFFKNALVLEPWDFVKAYSTELFGAHPEQSMPEYLAFLQFASAQGLHNKITGGKQRLKMAEILCAKAQELGISTSHPVVLVPVAVVYGCEDARLVMKFAGKPENFNPGNALGDIQSISRVAGTMTNFIQRAGGAFKNCKFKTGDSPLHNMLRYFTVQSVSTTEMSDGATHNFTVSVDAPSLYPVLFGADREPKDEKSRIELDRLFVLLGAEFSD
ncbi:hypothetical protein [Deefgea rivuli]|uniref:hypothetical protein n=1 Tax=Deefgea rivuli TaxID=400948 RepID=UPI000482BD2F|nr:hypothetical protein [Deefgea rivuli]